ncbi:MAG: S24/S26 family peptidase [Planctomycetes bacterium]|nr:S24/S26 family peptidase [Planctomycetota bacterium]
MSASGADPQAPRSARRFDPRGLIRPLRLLALAAVLFLLWRLLADYSLAALPEGEAPLFDFSPGQRVLVTPFSAERGPEPGDAVLFRTRAGETHLGRVVARAGDGLEVDVAGGRLRRSREPCWYPAPRRLLERLPLRPGEVLVLAEDALARESGAILAPGDAAERVLAGLPSFTSRPPAGR